MKSETMIQTKATTPNQSADQQPKLKLSKETIHILTSASNSSLEATLTRIC